MFMQVVEIEIDRPMTGTAAKTVGQVADHLQLCRAYPAGVHCHGVVTLVNLDRPSTVALQAVIQVVRMLYACAGTDYVTITQASSSGMAACSPHMG